MGEGSLRKMHASWKRRPWVKRGGCTAKTHNSLGGDALEGFESSPCAGLREPLLVEQQASQGDTLRGQGKDGHVRIRVDGGSDRHAHEGGREGGRDVVFRSILYGVINAVVCAPVRCCSRATS
eukprot:scaffold154273_cov37-Tisochrysis_lutea.AAC.2